MKSLVVFFKSHLAHFKDMWKVFELMGYKVNKGGGLVIGRLLLQSILFFMRCVVLKKTVCLCIQKGIYLLLVYFVTALVPSETACLANSPGSKRRTAVWISREEMVDFLF